MFLILGLFGADRYDIFRDTGLKLHIVGACTLRLIGQTAGHFKRTVVVHSGLCYDDCISHCLNL